VIIAVGADKGSPGVTTLAVLLGMAWLGRRVALELDPRGADLPLRLPGADGRPLAASPSVTTLAVDTRPGGPARCLLDYAQPSAAGVPVIAGEISSDRFTGLAAHLPAITAAAAGWDGAVIADVGCVQPWNPAMRLAHAAAVTVLVSRADTASLGHLRERVELLAAELGGPARIRPPLAVAVRAEPGEDSAAGARVAKLLASVGSPVPVLGVLPCDPAGCAALWAGRVPARAARRGVFAAARTLAGRLRQWWPELTEPAAPPAGGSWSPVAAGARP
jgi:hypothetical protein